MVVWSVCHACGQRMYNEPLRKEEFWTNSHSAKQMDRYYLAFSFSEYVIPSATPVNNSKR